MRYPKNAVKKCRIRKKATLAALGLQEDASKSVGGKDAIDAG